MGKSKKNERVDDESCSPLDTGALPQQEGKEVQIRSHPLPNKNMQEKKIHPRQPTPPIPEGEEVSDDDPTPPVNLD
jgi:hypothetical protein